MGRVAGSMLGEFAEKGWREYLEKNPTKFRGILEQLSKRSEVGAKVLGISAGEFARATISFLGRKYAGDSILIGALANTSDDVIRESAEAFVEFAKSGKWQHATASAKAAAPSKETSVVRDARPVYGKVVHRHTVVGKRDTGLCLDFRTQEDEWNASHHATVIKDQSGGGGGRGDRKGKGGGGPALKLADAEPFKIEKMTIAEAQDAGFTECPRCQPFTFATAEEQKKEAAMAETTAAADAAKNANAPKPIPGWETDVGAIGRWLAITFSASLVESDFGNEMRTVPCKLWMDRAIMTAKKHHPNVMADLSTTDVFDLNLPDTLTDEETEAVVRLIFTAGAGTTDKKTELKSLLDFFSGKKKKAEEAKKLADAKAKVANAPTIAEKTVAEHELLELQPKPSPWPRRLIIGGVVTFVLMVIIVMIAVAESMKY